MTTDLSALRKQKKKEEQALGAKLKVLTLARVLKETPPADLASALEAVETDRKRADQLAPIRALPEFRTPARLPELPLKEIGELLATSVHQLDANAQQAVARQLAALGEGSAEWVRDGLGFLGEGTDSSCPFCGQDLAESARPLIEAYRLHFSKEYERLQNRCAHMVGRIRAAIPEHLPDTLTANIEALRRARGQWLVHLSDLPAIPDLPDANAALETRNRLVDALERKKSNPVTDVSLNDETDDALVAWSRLAGQLAAVRYVLAELRLSSSNYKAQCSALYPVALVSKRDELLDWEQVVGPNFQTDLAQYKKTAAACNEKVDEVEEAKKALKVYQDELFPKYQKRINGYLDVFGASFSLHEVSKGKGSRGGERRVDYVLKAATTTVKVGATPAPRAPRFGSLLSSGDRRTLAFAVFLAYLQGREIDGATVACDDPTTSLDLDRRQRTVGELLGVLDRGAQLIVLSHFEPFLLDFEHRVAVRAQATGGASMAFTCLKVDGATHKSRLLPHSVDRRSRLVRHRDAVRAFVNAETLDLEGIVNECRRLLEGTLCVCFPDHYPAGGCLKNFCQRVKPLIAEGRLDKSTFEEIQRLRDFFNSESHFQAEAAPTATEVRTHAEQLLRLAQLRLGPTAADGPPA